MPATDIDRFLAKYDPAIAATVQACRKRLHRLVPRGFELVYDNYNALAFGYATSPRASDAVISIAAYPRWVTLFLLRGAALADPAGLLQGSGSRVRSIRLAGASDLGRAEIRDLIARALAPAATGFATAPKLATIVKSVSAKQRPRKPGVSARAAKPPSKTAARRARTGTAPARKAPAKRAAHR